MATDDSVGPNAIEHFDLENADGYVASATRYVCRPGEPPLDIVATRVTYIVTPYPILMGLQAHLGLVLNRFGAHFHLRSMWKTKETVLLVYLPSSDSNGFDKVVALFMESLLEFGIVMNPIRCVIENKLKLVP